MISVSIICNSKDQSDSFRMLINRIPFLYLVNCFEKADAGLEFASRSQIDLLIISGQYAKLLATGRYPDLYLNKAIIIFSDMPEDAVTAFDCNSLDFLRWPLSFDRFLTSMLKVQTFFKMLSQQKESVTMSPAHADTNLLFLRTGTAIQKINIHEITYFEKEGNYFHVHTAQSKALLVRINFEKLISLLPENQFLRVHKSYIVSIYHIDKIENDEILIGASKIPISSSYKDVFFDYIKKEFRSMNFRNHKAVNIPAA